MSADNVTNAVVLNPGIDTVAVVLHATEPGTAVRFFDNRHAVHSLTATELVPQYHKVAIAAVAAGEPVFKYGQVIGYATQAVAVGQWVHSHNLSSGTAGHPAGAAAPTATAVSIATATPPATPAAHGPALPPLSDRYFVGYRDRFGRAATRNFIVIAAMVDCSARVVQMATDELNKRRDYFARRYPNVDGIIGLTHDSGCGVAALSPGHLRQMQTLRNLIDHPNVAGRVVVQLGCEKSQAAVVFGSERVRTLPDQPGRWTALDELTDVGGESMNDRTTGDQPIGGAATTAAEIVPTVTVQDAGGTWSTVERIVQYVEQVLLPRANRRRRQLIGADELVVATQCGGSNALSGFTANAAIGYAADLIVRCNGSTFISETTETCGAEQLLAQRAKTPDIAAAYLSHVEWYAKYLAAAGATAQANLAHGNLEGGLTTIAEKSLGAIAKGGTSALAWVKDYGERITAADKGFGFMNGPAFDPASATGQTAGGALVGLFSTGAGSCFGGVLIPWIKVVSNTDTFRRLEDMEVNAGCIADGTASVAEVGRLLFEQVIAAAGGAKTYAEKVGYSVVNIWNSGVVT